MGSLSFSKDFVVFIVADEFEPCFYELADFLFRVGDLSCVVVVFEVDEVSID